MTGLRLRSAALLCPLALFPSAAFGQVCETATSAPVPGGTIIVQANKGFRLLESETQATGQERTARHQERVAHFRSLSVMNRTWLCAYRERLEGTPPAHARALARGIIYFDLAEDRLRAKRWLIHAEPVIRTLNPSIIPTYAGLRLDQIVARARASFAGPPKANSTWFVIVGDPA